jgi:hypothetical protein
VTLERGHQYRHTRDLTLNAQDFSSLRVCMQEEEEDFLSVTPHQLLIVTDITGARSTFLFRVEHAKKSLSEVSLHLESHSARFELSQRCYE